MENYILITGASGGIGKELSIALSKNNNLILSSNTNFNGELDKVRKECYNSENHLIWLADLNNEKQIIYNSLTEFILNNNICISSFIHCAGITKILPFRNFEINFVNQIFNINFFSSLEIIRCLIKKSNKGSLKNILFISALWSIRGNSGNSIYAASKGAINSLVLSLAQELAPKVRVNSLLPGAILTPMSNSLNHDFIEQLKKDTPLGIGNICDIVEYACFILSDKAKWVTGQNIIIDGGRSTK